MCLKQFEEIWCFLDCRLEIAFYPSAFFEVFVDEREYFMLLSMDFMAEHKQLLFEHLKLLVLMVQGAQRLYGLFCDISRS